MASATISLSLHAGLQRLGDVLVDAVDHRRRHVEQRQLVDALDLARLQHRLLAVAHLDAELLQLEQHRRLDDVDAERHVADALGVEQRLDLARRIAEQRDVGADGAAQAEQAGAAVVVVQPRRVQPVVLRRRAEVPDVGIAVAGEQRVARQLVARPLADHRARDVADVVLVEAQQRAQARTRRAPRACARAGSRAAGGSRRAPRSRPACGRAPAAAGPSDGADRCRRAGRSTARARASWPSRFRFLARGGSVRRPVRGGSASDGCATASRTPCRSTRDRRNAADRSAPSPGAAYLLRSCSTVAMPAASGFRSRDSPPLSASSRSYDRFASAGDMSRMFATSSASTTSRFARS